METKPTSQNEQQANRRYLTVWRWHFLCRAFWLRRFLTLLAVTGLGMLLFANITGKKANAYMLRRRQWFSLCRLRLKLPDSL